MPNAAVSVYLDDQVVDPPLVDAPGRRRPVVLATRHCRGDVRIETRP
jgi:hypothetical protein